MYWNGYDASWDNVVIQKYTGSTTIWELVDTIAATETTYELTGLTPQTSYNYTAGAVISGVTYSAYPPNYVQVLTNAILAPTGAAASDVTYEGMTLSWTNVDTYDSVKIYKSTTNHDVDLELIATLAASAETYDVTGLTGSTTYYFNICAVYDTTESCNEDVEQATPVTPTQPWYHWTFDETVTDEIESITLSEITGGTIQYQDGLNGAKALYLDGSTVLNSDSPAAGKEWAKIANVSDEGSYLYAKEWSMSVWVYVARDIFTDNQGVVSILDETDGGTFDTCGIGIRDEANNGMWGKTTWGTQSWFGNATGVTPPTSGWTHIVYRFYDYGNTKWMTEIYLDNVLSFSGQSTAGVTDSGGTDYPPYNLYVGDKQVGGNRYYGRIANLRYYNVKITDEDIAYLYTNQI